MDTAIWKRIFDEKGATLLKPIASDQDEVEVQVEGEEKPRILTKQEWYALSPCPSPVDEANKWFEKASQKLNDR